MSRINSEAEYLEALDRMVKGAEMIEHPLASEEQRKQYRRVYDAIEAEVLDWQRRQLNREQVTVESPQVEQQPDVPVEEAKPTVKLSAWLDDDE
ncbi:hypothetical protein E0485_14645 [Paenibacillus albiflavus]|uniref:Uncharacterized protein n=1 Tax=Paenibacillus albiflavus TaxID=2545760 RepID=A0A4V2WNM9_9BACL|nr:hypothetical protein [Paenibacillus albiflavus]TCZ76082.1 hypothetical protein E0485_14645 [Paenibacillus albiflavus]